MSDDFLKQNQKRRRVRSFVVLLLLAVILYALTQILGSSRNYKTSQDTYEGVTTKIVTNKSSSSNAKKRKAPIDVDFSAVKGRSESDSIIGWLYVEAVEISYPILQGTSNQQYLRTNLDGEYDICGSIFVDAENSSDFSDPNTIIFGHNITDGSMFGKLKELTLNNALQKSPYIWVITEDVEYCYKIFSIQVAETTDECYTLFYERGSGFEGFLRRMKQNSIEETGEFTFSNNDSILTLSTCNGSNTTSRYVVQAVKIR